MENNINELLTDVNINLKENVARLETILNLPIDYIKTNLSKEGLVEYIELRTQTIHLLELLEVIVYDTHEDIISCINCGAKLESKIIMKNNKPMEALNGEINHWVMNGKITHEFICDSCLQK